MSDMKPFLVQGPWKGIVTDKPSGFDIQALDAGQNILCRKGRIQSRPAIVNLIGLPPDLRPIKGMYSFQDVQNAWHTLILTDHTPYFLTYAGGVYTYNALTLPSGLSDLSGTGLPFSIVEMNQKVFFCNGSDNILYVDGSSNVYIAGDVPGSCLYLAENSSHLIGVNWVIPSPGIAGSATYPFYVIISDANNPFSWTPSSTNSATVINLIEKGGVPLGVQTLGTYTYVWRAYGANVLWPSGNAAAPFYNDPFSWSNPGWGLYYPYTLDTWNNQGLMVSHNGEVLLFNGAAGPSEQNFTPLAMGRIRTQLAKDLLLNTGAPVIAKVTDQLGPGFDFVSYMIWIPGPNKAWVYNLEEDAWTTFTSSTALLYPTSIANIKVQ